MSYYVSADDLDRAGDRALTRVQGETDDPLGDVAGAKQAAAELHAMARVRRRDPNAPWSALLEAAKTVHYQSDLFT